MNRPSRFFSRKYLKPPFLPQNKLTLLSLKHLLNLTDFYVLIVTVQSRWIILRQVLTSFSYMSALSDHPGFSRIQRQSPALPYGWPKSRLRRSLDQLPRKKLRFKFHMFQNFKIIRLLMLVLRFLASFSCVMHVVRCKQKEQSFFFVTPI